MLDETDKSLGAALSAKTWDENGREIFIEGKRPSRSTAMEFNEVFGNASTFDVASNAVNLLLKTLKEAEQ